MKEKKAIWPIVAGVIGLALLITGIVLLVIAGVKMSHTGPSEYNQTEENTVSSSSSEEFQELSSEEVSTTEDTEAIEPEPEALYDENQLLVFDEHLQNKEDYSQAPSDNGQPYYVKVNRLMNVVTVYGLDEDGRYTVPVRAMVCSVGTYNNTPVGTYHTEEKYEW